MQKEKTRQRAYLIASIVVVLAVVALIIWYASTRTPEETVSAAVTPRPTAEVKVREHLVEKLVQVEKEITVEEISGGLRDMGTLVTQEYYFTDVVTSTSVKKLFDLVELGITESGYIASYDGVVTAGVDFTGISVEKDGETGAITVRLPGAEILNVDIDPGSFTLYSEKTGLGNPMSIADYNSSLVELEQTAREKALEHGLLEQADKNARALILNFIRSLAGGDCAVRFEKA